MGEGYPSSQSSPYSLCRSLYSSDLLTYLSQGRSPLQAGASWEGLRDSPTNALLTIPVGFI